MTSPREPSPSAVLSVDDCWNRIGVRGDQSCPRLIGYGHCRNCPVHAQGATALLQRPVPADYRDERTGHFAQPLGEAAQRTQSLMLFRIGGEWLALPTHSLVEIVDSQPVRPLPHKADGVVLGLLSLRGELLICVSLGFLFGLVPPPEGQSPATRRDRIVVLQGSEGRLAFPVDEVFGTWCAQPGELHEVPVTVAKAAAAYTSGVLHWNGRTAGCLDVDLVLYRLNRSLG